MACRDSAATRGNDGPGSVHTECFEPFGEVLGRFEVSVGVQVAGRGCRECGRNVAGNRVYRLDVSSVPLSTSGVENLDGSNSLRSII